MTLVRRSVFAAPLLLFVALAPVLLGACSSGGKSRTPSSTPAADSGARPSTSIEALAPTPDRGLVTSSVATSDRGSTITAAAEAGAATTMHASGPAIVTSSVVTGSTTAPGTTPPAGSPGTGVAATTTTTAATTTAATPAAGTPASTTPRVGGTVPDDTTPTTTGNPAAFCAFESDIEDATNTDDDQVFLAALRSFEPRMTQWEADGPTVQLRLAASKLHSATKNAIAANTADAFDGQALNDAFLPISHFCASLGGPPPA